MTTTNTHTETQRQILAEVQNLTPADRTKFASARTSLQRAIMPYVKGDPGVGLLALAFVMEEAAKRLKEAS